MHVCIYINVCTFTYTLYRKMQLLYLNTFHVSVLRDWPRRISYPFRIWHTRQDYKKLRKTARTGMRMGFMAWCKYVRQNFKNILCTHT